LAASGQTARLVDLDRHLREIAHSLETKSVLSRPLGEILHREVDSFAERTGLRAGLEIRGDPDSLSSAQRITVFRAIQEALANVREHSGASSVEVRVRARRSAIEVQIADDGMGFEVERALAKPLSAVASASSALPSACACSVEPSRWKALLEARRA
jgi:signal transduction histidine kinase